jgi:hydroxyacylglutathione hydrolase
MDRAAFSAFKTREHHYVPHYFRKMEELNLSGAPLIHRIPAIMPLRNLEVHRLKKEGAQLLDIRAPTSYGAGHIPGGICIWREGLASFMGWFLNYEDPIVLVDDFNLEMNPVTRHFVRMGYDNLYGYLAGGFPAWFKGAEEIGQIESLSVQQLHERLHTSTPFLLDVRDINNWNEVGHIPGAHQCYVGELPRHMNDIPADKGAPIVAYCDAGYKGCLAASVLENAGYSAVSNLLGGMTAWVSAGYPVEK